MASDDFIFLQGIQIANKEPGHVSRVVPGKLVYVDVPSQGTLTFKPNRVAILESNGELRPYRGEPFDLLGLSAGSSVNVVVRADQPQYVVVDPRTATPTTTIRSVGDSLVNLAKTFISTKPL